MKAGFSEPFNLFKLTDTGLKFRIPLYQRPYAWEEPEVQQLIEDLDVSQKENPGKHYYIGILSVARAQDDPEYYDLIDGQQRLTTLLLLAKSIGLSELPELKLFGRHQDDQLFLKNPSSGKFPRANKKLLCTYETGKAYSQQTSIENINLEELIRNAHFFISEVPKGYSATAKNQQFVRMNNRGKQLEKHEILKVRLLGNIDGNKREIASKKWNSMIEYLSGDLMSDKVLTLRAMLDPTTDPPKDPPEQPNESLLEAILSIPEFLLIALFRYLYSKEYTGEIEKFSFNKDKLLQTFEYYFDAYDKDSLSDRILAFMTVLDNQCTALKRNFIFHTKDGQYRIGISDVDEESASIPGTSEQEMHLIALQSFLHVSTQPHQWLVPAFNIENNSIDKMLLELEKIDSQLNGPGFYNGLLKRNTSPIDEASKMVYRSISHYWFYRLDYELWKEWHLNHNHGYWGLFSKENWIRKLLESFRFRKCGSIEHIMPQHPVDETKCLDEVSLHHFGNLALISGSRNSRFSNMGPAAKKEMIESGSDPYTESLKMIHFLYCKQEIDDEKWIEKHGSEMYDLIKKDISN